MTQHAPTSQADGFAGSFSTRERVEDVIAATFGRPLQGVTDDMLLEEDLRIDALAMAVLVCAVEDQFAVTLPDAVAMRFRTVGDLVAWIDAQGASERSTS